MPSKWFIILLPGWGSIAVSNRDKFHRGRNLTPPGMTRMNFKKMCKSSCILYMSVAQNSLYFKRASSDWGVPYRLPGFGNYIVYITGINYLSTVSGFLPWTVLRVGFAKPTSQSESSIIRPKTYSMKPVVTHSRRANNHTHHQTYHEISLILSKWLFHQI